jgi:two-component system, sensor histidine kinase and response regulator
LLIHDISEHMHIEENLRIARDRAETADQAKSVFMAMMSHEIRTPMNGVLGLAQLLQNGPLDDRQSRFVKGILSSGESLLSIINDILNLSKIEAGQTQLDLIEFNFRELLEEIGDLMATGAHAKKVDLSMLNPPDLPEILMGTPIEFAKSSLIFLEMRLNLPIRVMLF